MTDFTKLNAAMDALRAAETNIEHIATSQVDAQGKFNDAKTTLDTINAQLVAENDAVTKFLQDVIAEATLDLPVVAPIVTTPIPLKP